jgi:hypothetical protein
MEPTPRHRRAEEDFRRLIASAGLEAPDGVEYASSSLVFRWEGPKLAVVVDLEDGVEDAERRLA